jgi:hypothetical protein
MKPPNISFMMGCRVLVTSIVASTDCAAAGAFYEIAVIGRQTEAMIQNMIILFLLQHNKNLLRLYNYNSHGFIYTNPN